jgi:hypothetical protein
LYNDSVEFLCLPDGESSRLRKVKNDLLRLVTGIPDNHGKSNSKGKTVRALLNAFWQDSPALSIGHFSVLSLSANITRDMALCQGHARIGKQPPRVIPA